MSVFQNERSTDTKMILAVATFAPTVMSTLDVARSSEVPGHVVVELRDCILEVGHLESYSSSAVVASEGVFQCGVFMTIRVCQSV